MNIKSKDPCPHYSIFPGNKTPTLERVIDIIPGYILRFRLHIETDGIDELLIKKIKEYIHMNNIFPNRKTDIKDELMIQIIDKLVKLSVFTENEIGWLRNHGYFIVFIHMLQQCDTVSVILSSKESSLIR